MYGRTNCQKNRQNTNKNCTVGNCFLQRGHLNPVTHGFGTCNLGVIPITKKDLYQYYLCCELGLLSNDKTLIVYFSASHISSESKRK